MEYLWTGNQYNKNRWAIEKQVVRICFGVPGYIKEWIVYSTHETLEDAEKELKRLQNFADPLAYEEYQIVDKRSEVLWNVRYG